ncbi:MAG TPA: hypothetical protein VG895_02905 [Patescibacteria group bacterium]|nr:hypothetical protein [Patescibacteria group bacterium]
MESAVSVETVATNASSQVEKLLKTEADFLGTKPMGFDARRYGELNARLESAQLQRNQTYQADLLDRKNNPNRLKASLGNTQYSKRLSSLDKEVKDLDREINEEELKRSDSEDLAIAVSRVHGVVKNTFGIELSSKLAPGDSFLEMAGREPVQREEDKGEKVSHEVWFHTTRHLGHIIETGGLATQSWMERHDPEYFSLHQENSSKNNFKGIDYDKWSPMQEEDKDRIFFSVDTHFDGMDYGNNIIAYAPEDILADNNLYFYEGKFGKFPYERVVSDVCDTENDSVPPNGDSDLLLPLGNAYIGVPKSDYQKTCIQLLKNGYSEGWIREHTLSYRGNIYEHKGQIVAANEIKRRINNKRLEEGNKRFTAVGNPNAKTPEFPNIRQLVTIAS